MKEEPCVGPRADLDLVGKIPGRKRQKKGDLLITGTFKAVYISLYRQQFYS
jgi:hypothetical protein